MISILTDEIRWQADALGETLTLRTHRAREIADQIKPDKKYRIEIKEFREKRSLDQNAMYWSILGQLAKHLKLSRNRLHNILLRRYSAPWTADGSPIYSMALDTDEAEEQILEAEKTHLKPTSRVIEGKDGNIYRLYVLLKGSSAMDKEEFSALMDGILDECRQAGLELIWEE